MLVAIAIPVFTTQLEKSREATDMANIRSAYAQVVTEYLGSGNAATATVASKQTTEGWITTGTDLLGLTLASNATTTDSALGGKAKGATWEVKCDDKGNVTIDGKAVKSQKITTSAS